MPRNASGTYTLPSGNPVVSGTLIDATWANNTLSDLGNEVTDSLSRSGEGAMLAPLRITDGVQATPSLAFSNEPSSGLYRAGSNEWWAVAAGVQNLRFTNTGLTTRAAAGAVGTPSLAAFNDTDTGIYFPGANELAIATGGVGALWVNSSQNVGVGASSPAYKFHVERPSYGVTGYFFANDGTRNPRLVVYGSSSGTTIQHTFSTGADSLIFAVGGAIGTGTEVARFVDGGNLGIGTASPESKLDVRNGYITGVTDSAVKGSKLLANYYTAGALSTWGAEFSTGAPMMGYAVWPSPLSANSFVSSTALSNLTRGAYTIEGAAHKWFIGGSQTVAVDGAVTMSRAMTLDAAGYLGIGTTSPGSRLHVDAPTNTVQIRAGDGNVLTYAAYSSGVSTNALNYYGTASNHDLGFLTNNAERARITKTGNIVAGASVALATTATDGFLYVPTCAGTPTGTPTAITGMAPIVVNTTNNKLYFYSGGAWRDAGP